MYDNKKSENYSQNHERNSKSAKNEKKHKKMKKIKIEKTHIVCRCVQDYRSC